ncbi:unnamed protein product [Prunus armeniaca]|uniref:Uncharacterized protein n=1 Tax=Prunus armeniaca TaxID=36596 RepID=A0A6J5TIZ9_PRUAR|nr:unnamed protein product [Prunus armeniaca]
MPTSGESNNSNRGSHFHFTSVFPRTNQQSIAESLALELTICRTLRISTIGVKIGNLILDLAANILKDGISYLAADRVSSSFSRI